MRLLPEENLINFKVNTCVTSMRFMLITVSNQLPWAAISLGLQRARAFIYC